MVPIASRRPAKRQQPGDRHTRGDAPAEVRRGLSQSRLDARHAAHSRARYGRGSSPWITTSADTTA